LFKREAMRCSHPKIAAHALTKKKTKGGKMPGLVGGGGNMKRVMAGTGG